MEEKRILKKNFFSGFKLNLSSYNPKRKNEDIKKKIEKNFDLSPRGIREMLGLNKPIYEVTSAYGHFGRKPTNNGEFSWEKTDKIDIFKM